MTVEDNITAELDRIEKELQRLHRMKITVGIQGVAGKNVEGEVKTADADIMTIAGVHEFGATIKAKNVKNLAIPIAKKAVGKSPLDFDNLFFIRSQSGFLFGCISNKKNTNPRKKGKPTNKKPDSKKPGKNAIPKKDNDIEYLFILFPATEIPERSFIRAGYDSSKENITEGIKEAVDGVIFNGWDAETAANHIGMIAVNSIVTYMSNAGNFKQKGSIVRTTSNWPDNPLIETGRLRNSITYVITEEG